MESSIPENQPQENLITDYHADIRQIEIEGYELVVKKARNALFWAAGIILLSEVIAIAMLPAGMEVDPISYVFIAIIVGIFIALALWTKKKPYTAIVLGIIAFISYLVLVAVVNGYADGIEGVIKAVVGGWLFKIFVFAALFRPLREAKELQRIKEEKAL